MRPSMGFGVTDTEATEEEIQEEVRFTESKGWVVCMNDTYDVIEEAVWSDGASNENEDTFELARESAPIKITRAMRRTFRVAHLFSGRRRKWGHRVVAVTPCGRRRVDDRSLVDRPVRRRRSGPHRRGVMNCILAAVAM